MEGVEPHTLLDSSLIRQDGSAFNPHSKPRPQSGVGELRRCWAEINVEQERCLVDFNFQSLRKLWKRLYFLQGSQLR